MSVQNLVKAINTLSNSIRNLGISFQMCTPPKVLHDSVALTVTNYKCSKCGCGLLLTGHTQDEIIYVCICCGKTHKARKNKVLGRFENYMHGDFE